MWKRVSLSITITITIIVVGCEFKCYLRANKVIKCRYMYIVYIANWRQKQNKKLEIMRSNDFPTKWNKHSNNDRLFFINLVLYTETKIVEHEAAHSREEKKYCCNKNQIRPTRSCDFLVVHATPCIP